jgi:uncharacterized OB-fold protein
MSTRPMPKVEDVSREFWAAANRGQLRIQRCLATGCGKYVFYPRVCCPHCGGGSLAWEDVSGRGRIVSYTLVHRPQHESFHSEVPIYFLAVRLDEGPVLYSRLTKRPARDDGLIGRAVQVAFGEPVEGQVLPLFELVEP